MTKSIYWADIEVPALPQRINQFKGKSWHNRAKEKEQWLWWIHTCNKGPKLKTPLNAAHLTLTRYSSQQPDYDGLVISFKTVIDCLVTLGYILNDSPKVIGYPIYNWEKWGAGEGRVRIFLQETVRPGIPILPGTKDHDDFFR